MTCIVAETDGRTVLFGADSAWTHEDEIYTLEAPKVFARGPYLFGVCGRYRIAQILRYQAQLPEPAPSAELEPFLVQELVPAIRQAATTCGETTAGRAILGEKTVVLLGCQGQLWTITSDLVALREDRFAAIGSGRLRAYGALHALHAARVEPSVRRLELALAAAAAYTASVRPPWHFVEAGGHIRQVSQAWPAQSAS